MRPTVGDKVRVILSCEFYERGMEGVILEDDGDRFIPYRVEFKTEGFYQHFWVMATDIVKIGEVRLSKQQLEKLKHKRRTRGFRALLSIIVVVLGTLWFINYKGISMKYSEDGLKVGDKVICIKSTEGYRKGDVGVVTVDYRQPRDTAYTNLMAIFDGDSMGGLGYYVEKNTIKLLETVKPKSWLYRFLFQRIG